MLFMPYIAALTAVLWRRKVESGGGVRLNCVEATNQVGKNAAGWLEPSLNMGGGYFYKHRKANFNVCCQLPIRFKPRDGRECERANQGRKAHEYECDTGEKS